jgi:small subunit ribosomal protein S8
MSFNDPIAELLTIIRNGLSARHKYVDVIISKEKKAIVRILHEQGFLLNYLIDDERKKMRVFLKYSKNRSPIIKGLQRISNPGLRKYVGWRKIPSVFNGFGMAIVSTSHGVMTDREAKEKKVGGEFLCKVW